jgi:Kef-type K+ transport system membrane component KefB
MVCMMETGELLRDLAVMFAGAKLAGAIFEKLKQPAVIGELIVGIILGPHLLEVIGHSATHEAFQELGAIILLFAVGLDTPLSDLQAVGGRSAAVGSAGIVLPFSLGVALISLTSHSTNEALFVGAAMVATSVGVTARVLADLGRIKEPESRVILGAAVVDDILGLLILAVVAGAAEDSVSVGSVVLLALLALMLVALVGGLGPRLVRSAMPTLDRIGDKGVLVVALALCLALAATADELGLAAIIGAFLAGMALAETRARYRLEENLAPIYSFLVPFFFVVTGSLVDLTVFAETDVLLLTLGVIAVAIAGKLIGCGLAAASMGRRSATIVGVGMVPRGEVGILVATIGLTRGIIGRDLYTIVVAMSVITTLLVPPLLVGLFRGRPLLADDAPGVDRTTEIDGVGG